MVGTLWRTPRLRRLPECVTCGAPLVSARELEMRVCTYCIPVQPTHVLRVYNSVDKSQAVKQKAVKHA